jgi:hypothetical protein
VSSQLRRPAGAAGRRRFSLLETIREYARERLRESGQLQKAHDRHAAYFLELAESARAGLEGPSQVAWLDRLAAADAPLQAAGTGWLVAYAATAPSDDDALPGLRSQMGDATFQQAWALGAAMGRQRAVEYALQDRRPVPGRPRD